MDIQLILEIKNSFGKYHPVFPKKKGHPIYFIISFLEVIERNFIINMFMNLLELLVKG